MAMELGRFWASTWQQKAKYEPLPSHAGRGSRRKRFGTQIVMLSLLGATVIIAVGFVWISKSGGWFKKPWSPLENYRDINTLPMVPAPFPSPADPSKHAIVSTLYSDSYAIAAAVLAHSARARTAGNSSARLILAYPAHSARISPAALCVARAAGWALHPVPLIEAPNGGKGVYHRFLDTFTKLQIWGLDKSTGEGEGGVENVVYLDADTLVRRNFDELFALPWGLGAVPDVYSDKRGFAVTFNSGVLALRTSSAALAEMRRVLGILAEEAEAGTGTGDGVSLGEADQSFLNAYYGASAVRLPYAYNANLAIKVRSPGLWGALVGAGGGSGEMRVVHYTLVKPFVRVREVDAEDGRESKLKVLLGEGLRAVMEEAQRERGGLFKEEVAWWWDAYEGMMRERGDEIEQCLL